MRDAGLLGRFLHYFGLDEDDIDFRLTEASLMVLAEELATYPPVGCVFIVQKEG